MKKVRFIISGKYDRGELMRLLKINGYNAKLVASSEYTPAKQTVEVEVKDYEVKE